MRLFKKLAYLQSQLNPPYATYNFAKDIPSSYQRNKLNLFSSVNSAIDIALASDPTYISYNQVPRSSAKTLNSEECLDAQRDCAKSTELIECLIRLYPSKAFSASQSDWQSLATRLWPKYNSETIFSQPLIRSSTKQRSTGIGLEDSFSVAH